MFQTDTERQGRAALMDTPTGIVFGGPGYGLDDYQLGPMLVNELTMSLFVALAVLNILHVVRHTRAEEETGRAELLRSTPLGSAAQMTAALSTAAALNLFISGLIAVSMVGFGLTAADSVAYALGLALGGISFAAVAAVCVQLSENGRASAGLSFMVLGLLFMARVIGDISEEGGNALSWSSPFAWAQQTRPFDDLRWWPLALYAVFIAVAFVAAHLLADRRDVGAGLMTARPGPAGAGPLLRGVFTLHLHQQRGSIAVWSVAVFVLAASFGSLAVEVEDMIATNPDLAVMLGTGTDDLVGGFLSAITAYVLMGASAFGALSVLRAWNEENSGRAELVLATAVGRVRWMGTALLVAALATVSVTLLGGLGLGLGAAAGLEDAHWTWTMVEAALAQLPVAVTFGALVALLMGVLPRLLPLVWLWLGYSVLVAMLGALLGMPDWAMNLGAFEILPALPTDDFEVLPFLLHGAVVLMAGAVGLAGFGRRDLATG